MLYGLRLLVALLTFAVGVAAAWLLNVGPSKHCGVSQTTEVTPVSVMSDVPRTRLFSIKRSIVEGGLLDGKALSKPAPDYPVEARIVGVEGTVVVRVLLEDDGSVLSAVAVSGPRWFREVAVEAARKARFAPTYFGASPTRVSGTLTYDFVLR